MRRNERDERSCVDGRRAELKRAHERAERVVFRKLSSDRDHHRVRRQEVTADGVVADRHSDPEGRTERQLGLFPLRVTGGVRAAGPGDGAGRERTMHVLLEHELRAVPQKPRAYAIVEHESEIHLPGAFHH